MAKCKVCGSDLVKKKTKTGEVVLYCQECKKIYRLKAKAEEVKKKVEEEEEEEEEAPAPVVAAPKKEEKPAPAPVVEGEKEEEEEEEEIVAPAPKKAPIPVVEEKKEEVKEEKAAPAPVAPVVVPAPAVNNEAIESIAESLAEINDSLKGLLKIFGNIFKA